MTDAGVRMPPWLGTPQRGLPACAPSGRRLRRSFVEKTLADGADLVRRTVQSDEYAGAPGLLQRLDPRTKLVSLLVLLVALGLVHTVQVLAVAYVALLGLAVASHLPVRFFVTRVWLVVPLFTGVLVLPATLSPVLPGEVVLQLWTWHGAPQGFTAVGLSSALLVVTRVGCSVSLVLLLTATTSWTRLLAALGAVGVPPMFVMVTSMAYRYVFLLLGTVTDMYAARTARSAGHRRHDRAARRFAAAGAGALVGKAHHLSEEVHQAMVSRGYRGGARPLTPFAFGRADLVAALAVAAMAAAVILGDLHGR